LKIGNFSEKCALYAYGPCAVVSKAAICSLYPMNHQKKSKGRGSLLEEQELARKKIGNRIKQLRKATGLSQEKFANHHGIDRTQVSRLERGVSNIELNTLVIFIRALDITLQEFFAGMD
jgi:DNA-binding XRE family transcriptional regulator